MAMFFFNSKPNQFLPGEIAFDLVAVHFVLRREIHEESLLPKPRI